MGAVVGIIGAVVGAVGARKQRKEARKAQKRAEKIDGRRADITNARANRKRLVQARRLRAQAIAQGETTGISGSSTVAGAAGSVQTTAAGNISFQNQLSGLDQARFSALGQANDALGKAASFQAVGNLSTQLGQGSFGEQFATASDKVSSFFNKG